MNPEDSSPEFLPEDHPDMEKVPDKEEASNSKEKDEKENSPQKETPNKNEKRPDKNEIKKALALSFAQSSAQFIFQNYKLGILDSFSAQVGINPPETNPLSLLLDNTNSPLILSTDIEPTLNFINSPITKIFPQDTGDVSPSEIMEKFFPEEFSKIMDSLKSNLNKKEIPSQVTELISQINPSLFKELNEIYEPTHETLLKVYVDEIFASKAKDVILKTDKSSSRELKSAAMLEIERTRILCQIFTLDPASDKRRELTEKTKSLFSEEFLNLIESQVEHTKKIAFKLYSSGSKLIPLENEEIFSPKMLEFLNSNPNKYQKDHITNCIRFFLQQDNQNKPFAEKTRELTAHIVLNTNICIQNAIMLKQVNNIIELQNIKNVKEGQKYLSEQSKENSLQTSDQEQEVLIPTKQEIEAKETREDQKNSDREPSKEEEKGRKENPFFAHIKRHFILSAIGKIQKGIKEHDPMLSNNFDDVSRILGSLDGRL